MDPVADVNKWGGKTAVKEKKQSGLTFGCGRGKELLRSYIRHLLKKKGQQTFSGFVSLAGKQTQIYTFVFSVKGLSSHKCGHKCLEVKFISHTALHSQSTVFNQPVQRTPSVPSGPSLIFSWRGNIRWHCCATWNPLKEMLSKTAETEEVRRWLCSVTNTKAPAPSL